MDDEILDAAREWARAFWCEVPDSHKGSSWASDALLERMDPKDLATMLEISVAVVTGQPEEARELAGLREAERRAIERDHLSRARHLASGMLRRGHPLPKNTRLWIADQLEAASARRGRPDAGARDGTIEFMVSYLAGVYCLPRTRNDASTAVSACDVVAEVVGLDFQTVKGVWKKRDKEVHP